MTGADEKMPMRGVIYALLASLLFGVTTPLAKAFLTHISPVLLAGLFYLGSGIGLGIYSISIHIRAGAAKSAHQPLRGEEIVPLMAAVFSGGIVAPVLLMFGLSTTPASTSSLFLNLESIFTAAIAWFVFKESYDRRLLLGMLLIVAGGILLSTNLTHGFTVAPGALLIAGACLGWGIDNNFTRQVANADPAQIACIKGLVAGITNVALAVALGTKMPPADYVVGSMIVGFLGYGVSLVLFVLALRHIGTARTGAYFSLAPFVGAVISIWALQESPDWQFFVAGAFMAAGLWLHLSEKHEHEHTHEPLEHEHEHVHDEHHQHEHQDEHGNNLVVSADIKHSHRHKHERLVHSHPHFPDMHHRHEH